MKEIVSDSFLDALKESHFFVSRTGMDGKKHEGHKPRLKVGDYISFSSCCVMEEHSTIAEGKRFFSLGSFASIASSLAEGSSVGRYSSIAPGLSGLGYRHPIEAVSTSSAFFKFTRENVHSYYSEYEGKRDIEVPRNRVPTPQPDRKGIHVGHDVWIGRNVKVKGGITIGHGAIVASDSLVTKDIPPYAIVGGTPAKLIKWRFAKEVVSALEESKWWKYELGDMLAEGLNFSDPKRFIADFSDKKHNLNIFRPGFFSPFLFFKTGRGKLPYGNYLVSSHGNIMFYDNQTSTLVFAQWHQKKADYDPVQVGKNGTLYCSNDRRLCYSTETLGIFPSNSVEHSPILAEEDENRLIFRLGDDFLSDHLGRLRRKPAAGSWERFIYLGNA